MVRQLGGGCQRSEEVLQVDVAERVIFSRFAISLGFVIGGSGRVYIAIVVQEWGVDGNGAARVAGMGDSLSKGVLVGGSFAEWEGTDLLIGQPARIIQTMASDEFGVAFELVAAVGVLVNDLIAVAVTRPSLHGQFHGTNSVGDQGLLLARHHEPI